MPTSSSRSSLTSLGLAALAGATLGGAGLALLPSGAPRGRDAEAASMMRAATERGLPDGRIRIVEPHHTRERQVARDPRQPDVMQIRLLERPEPCNVLLASRRDLERHLFGDFEQFLKAYRVAAGPVYEGEGDQRAVSFEWRRGDADDGATRRVWIREKTGEMFRIVERNGRGDVLRSLEIVARGLEGWNVAPAAAFETSRVLSRRARPEFVDFVESLAFPMYEPATLPPNFRRSDWGLDRRGTSEDGRGEALSLAWVTYTDGMLKLNLFVTTKDRMRRLEEIARQQTTAAGSSACPTSPADTPEELIEDAAAIHRRDDGCRYVLRREIHDDARDQDVAVVLVGYRGLASEDYVRTMRSLVRVAGPTSALKPGEVPVK